MTADRQRVRERLAHIGEAVSGLRTLAAVAAGDFHADFRNLRTSERLLQTAIQAMLDVATHIVARAGLPRPETNEALFTALAQSGALHPDRVSRCREMAGLRNLLVHEYVRVAPSQIRGILDRDLGDFDAFVADVGAWLARPES